MIWEIDLFHLMTQIPHTRNRPDLAYRKKCTSLRARVLYKVDGAHLKKAREPTILWLLRLNRRQGFIQRATLCTRYCSLDIGAHQVFMSSYGFCHLELIISHFFISVPTPKK